ncbi:hypothetical protein T12_16482 [Trichinella patagoniensis]|uniref:Uncharacterized protein n=1 Tax=Trichinella patagoniensis TaxID=990121 RepID=A0A0V0ZNT2_9BILA|nr:hypothetical protein T12_16482 [Trichinella patagoniensis]
MKQHDEQKMWKHAAQLNTKFVGILKPINNTHVLRKTISKTLNLADQWGSQMMNRDWLVEWFVYCIPR